MPKPSATNEQKDSDLVCGCDHVTYWNANIAAQHGASVAASGACLDAMAVPCSSASPCPTGLRCNEKITDASQCNATAQGTCWGVPIACPFTDKQANACTNNICAGVCALIQSQHPWYDDGSCP
jgi:hypothetical protein